MPAGVGCRVPGAVPSVRSGVRGKVMCVYFVLWCGGVVFFGGCSVQPVKWSAAYILYASFGVEVGTEKPEVLFLVFVTKSRRYLKFWVGGYYRFAMKSR